MAVFCLNRRRGKRPIPSVEHGGRVNCPGKMIVSLTVPIILPLKSARNESPEKAFTKYVLKYGVRIDPATLVAAFRSSATCDIRCDTCKYSRKAMLALTRTRTARGGGVTRK